MADEITLNFRMQLANGSDDFDFNPGRQLLTQTTQGRFDSIRSIATTETSISLTGITTPGRFILQNLDATNYVEWGTTTTDYPCKLIATEQHSGRLNTGKTTLYLKANTAACKVRIIVCEA
jgi:hypothetical protein